MEIRKTRRNTKKSSTSEKPRVTACTPDGSACPAPPEAPVAMQVTVIRGNNQATTMQFPNTSHNV